MYMKTVVICIASVTVILIIAYIIFEEAIREIFFPSPQSCDDEVCVRFCCLDTSTCGNVNISASDEAKELSENYRVLTGKPCDDLYGEDAWGFLQNGHVYDIYNLTYDSSNYCIVANGTNINLFICAPKQTVDRLKLLYPYLMLASLPFLVITLAVYACIRELRNLHGKSLMAYVSSLILMYTLLVIFGLFDQFLVENYNGTCRVLGYMLMAAVFMCFFWLNVMCLDIWTTFKGKGIRKDDTKFFKYCVYAFGIPALLVSLVSILNESKVITDDYGTGIGHTSCTVTDGFDTESTGGGATSKRQLIYIYAPIAFFIVINTVFYSVTACKIYRVQKETSIVRRGESCKHAKKEQARFFLYMRLFVIMGIPWIIELISWFAKNSVILHAASVINCLQGFIIFLLFVWQSKVQKMLERRYPSMTQTISMSSRRSQATKSESLSFDATKKSSQ